jgi:hypothetical protein
MFGKKTTNYVRWNQYRAKIEFLNEFYYQQAQLKARR